MIKMETSTILEILGEGNKTYSIERIERCGEVVWLGFNTNLFFVDEQWFQIIETDFIPCGVPEYEKLYLKTL